MLRFLSFNILINWNGRYFYYSALLALFFFFSIYTSPVFASLSNDLATTKKETEEAKIRSKKLESEQKEIIKKRKELSEKMVKTAAAIQISEAKLSAIEEKMRILSVQITEKTDSLLARKKELATMVQASLKLSQTPPEAIIIMPGDMMDNMKASRALKMTTDSIKTESENIRLQMAELELLKEQVSKNQEEAIGERKELEEQRLALKKQIEEHNILQKNLDDAQKKEKTKLESLAKKAEDLQNLIAALEKEKEQEQSKNDDLVSDSSPPSGQKGQLRSFKARKGNIRVPAAGKLIRKYGVEERNETSKGITIQTRDNAQVTAPFDAEVLFTGPFMEYGKVIIMRHSDGFHTLLAGITKIDVSVGEFLLEGEPIGAMGNNGQENNLYMEIRSNNRPTNPAPWVRGLGK